MKLFDKWWFPNNEEHLQEWMTQRNDVRHGRLTYQAHKYDEALKHTKQRRLAIDVGAHVGLWSFLMAHDFKNVAAFEPMPAHLDCWRENMKKKKNATSYHFALGAQAGMVSIETRTANSSGDTGISAHEGPITMRTLDSFDFRMVDLIKIDCEGYEAFVLHGAEKTLLRCKPCVIVEQKRDMSLAYGLDSLEAVRYLEGLGAVQRASISGDYILSWE